MGQGEVQPAVKPPDFGQNSHSFRDDETAMYMMKNSGEKG